MPARYRDSWSVTPIQKTWAYCASAVSIVIFAWLSSAAAQEATELPDTYAFEGYEDVPDVAVVSRKNELVFYPCDQCHAGMETDNRVRELTVMHVAEIDHGQGRIWCLSCHDAGSRNYLTTLLDEPVDFDQSQLVCGGCHSSRHRDWTFGVHGKRADNWQGDRTVYSCTHCHDPHSPAIEPRKPMAPPRPRVGLELERGEQHEATPAWARQAEEEE